MTKNDQKREAQGWRGMAPCCANCTHNNNDQGTWDTRSAKAIACRLGDFPTSALAWCPKHVWREYGHE